MLIWAVMKTFHCFNGLLESLVPLVQIRVKGVVVSVIGVS